MMVVAMRGIWMFDVQRSSFFRIGEVRSIVDGFSASIDVRDRFVSIQFREMLDRFSHRYISVDVRYYLPCRCFASIGVRYIVACVNCLWTFDRISHRSIFDRLSIDVRIETCSTDCRSDRFSRDCR